MEKGRGDPKRQKKSKGYVMKMSIYDKAEEK